MLTFKKESSPHHLPQFCPWLKWAVWFVSLKNIFFIVCIFLGLCAQTLHISLSLSIYINICFLKIKMGLYYMHSFCSMNTDCYFKMLDVLGFSSAWGAYYKNQRSQSQVNIGRKESLKEHHLFQILNTEPEVKKELSWQQPWSSSGWIGEWVGGIQGAYLSA